MTDKNIFQHHHSEKLKKEDNGRLVSEKMLNTHKKRVVQFTHVFATGCCPTVCPVPEGPEAQLTKIFFLCWALRRRSEGKKEGSRATTVCPNRAVRMRKYCRLPTAVLCVLLPLSLSIIQRGRERQSLSHEHVFLLSHFFQRFSYLWRTDSKEKRMNHEEEEKQIVWMRVMILLWSHSVFHCYFTFRCLHFVLRTVTCNLI